MKILFINGSSHQDGVTNRAILEMTNILDANEISYDIVQVGNLELAQCSGCGYCYKQKRCVNDDIINEVGAKLDVYDAIVVGSPVHYASASGLVTTFLDRLFYCYSKKMSGKVYAAFACARRGGTTATLDQLNKYPFISGMLMVGSQYWNLVHGNTKEELEQDLEGLQTLRTLTINIIYLLKLIECGRKNNIYYPEREKFQRTNFIR